MITVTKQWKDLPAAHRQHNHGGHCRFIHGHNWGFDVVFACNEVDANGFVIDVGDLHRATDRLHRLFDHTLLINSQDPERELFEQLHEKGIVELVVVSNCGMEALAQRVHSVIQSLLDSDIKWTQRCVHVVSVTCHEDSKNSATYYHEGDEIPDS